MNGRIGRVVWFLLFSVFLVSPVLAQADPPERRQGGPGELQREMRKFFGDQLRAELDLTDDQVEQIMPKVQALEQERGAVRRERVETMRGLRRGLESGAPDAELQQLLDRYDGIDRKNLELKEKMFSEIDESLTVRQRVRMRFFVERFPRMMRDKIEDLRGGPPGRGGRGRYERGGGDGP